LIIDLGPLVHPPQGSPYKIPFDKCDIHVLEPLAARTVFAILKTPVVQHDTWRPEAARELYPVASLGSVVLSPGAYLHCNASPKLRSMRFDLALSQTHLKAPPSTPLEQDHMFQTAWELLKLWRYCIRPEYADPDVMQQISDDMVAQRYLSARIYPHSDLTLTMARSTLDFFLDAVSGEINNA
jgi:hypothetical protein